MVDTSYGSKQRMSTEQSVDPELVEQTKQQIRNLVREIAQISKSEIAPVDFYDAVLSRIVTALAAVGGAIWTVAENGQLMLEYEINLRETRLGESEENQVRHGRLLRKEGHDTPAGRYELLITDLPVTHGDSGSGLFDERGQLVGLNTWTKIEDGYSHGISLPSEAMRALSDAVEHGDFKRLDDMLKDK